MTTNNPLDWENHQVDYLFLLIGENPLPNYVAAETLLREGGKPCLVYTEHTKDAARILQKILNLDENDKLPLGRHESNAFEIRKAIKNKVEEIKDENIKAGKDPSKICFALNYTGGTKAMAVHAYQAFLESDISTEIKFSYLDPRNLKMLIDQKNSSPIRLDIFDKKIKTKVDIPFERLFELHDLRWKQHDAPIFQPSLYDAAKEIIVIYENKNYHSRKEVADSYQSWCKDELSKAKKANKYWQEESDLEKLSLNINDVPQKIKQVFQKYMGISGQQLHLKIAKNLGFNSYQDFCGWLNCGWLEHYVLWQIQQIPDSLNLNIDESAMSFHIEDPDNKNAIWDKFEFDVAFRRRYQLFAISCTTSIHDNTCKEKLFEAYVRARQLGGAESKVALVCLHHDTKRLEKQMKILTQDNKIAVFGINHLMNLSQKITNWIQGKDY
ncbi:MAG: DUF1887 domain-containing protein [Aphanizomenon gracile PMC627.10]|nr:DUF1887 domain-containing protein [Aphanizomenon gracile PMC627.10]